MRPVVLASALALALLPRVAAAGTFIVGAEEEAPTPTTALEANAVVTASNSHGLALIEPTIAGRVTDVLWLRLGIGFGVPISLGGTGTAFEVRTGFEARTCTATRFACAFGGVDAAIAGAQITSSAGDEMSAVDLGVEPRIGAALGSDKLALQAAVGARRTIPLGDSGGGDLALTVSLGLATHF